MLIYFYDSESGQQVHIIELNKGNTSDNLEVISSMKWIDVTNRSDHNTEDLETCDLFLDQTSDRNIFSNTLKDNGGKSIISSLEAAFQLLTLTVYRKSTTWYARAV